MRFAVALLVSCCVPVAAFAAEVQEESVADLKTEISLDVDDKVIPEVSADGTMEKGAVLRQLAPYPSPVMDRMGSPYITAEDE